MFCGKNILRNNKLRIHSLINVLFFHKGQMIEANYLSVDIVADHHTMKNDISWSHVIMLHRKGNTLVALLVLSIKGIFNFIISNALYISYCI